MADTMGDLTNALLNQYSNSFPNNKSFNDIKNSIIEGMKEVLGTNKMTSDGYFYKGNTKDSQEQRSAYNDIIKNFNDEENLIKKQYALKKSHEAELAALKAKYHITSSNQEEQLAKKILNDYKKLYEYQFDEKRKYYKQLDDEETKIYKNSLDKGEKLTKEQLKQLKTIEEKRKAIQENWPSSMSDALKNAFSKTWEEFDVKKKIGDALNYLSDTYFFNQLKSGFSNYNTAYEQNFTSIAGRTGYGNRSETHQLITDVISEVNSTNYLNKGLNFNKDVFPEIVNATKQGFLGDEAQEVAISNAIDKKIMPWLDTSSDTWINMRYELSDDMLQSIKGQQLLLQETREGNRILQDGVASVLLDSMQPTLLNIDANTTEFDDLLPQAQGIYSYYREFMDKQDAMKITKEVIDIYQNPGKALLNSSSSTSSKLMDITAVNGGDMFDIMKSKSNLYGLGIGASSLAKNAMANAFGLETGNWTRDDSTFKKANDYEALAERIEIFKGNDEDTKQKYLNTIGELSNYVTATQEYDNKLENAMTNAIKDSTTIAHFADIGERVLSNIIDIKRILIGNLVGELGNLFKNKKLSNTDNSFLKNLLGSQSNESGLLGLLNKGGSNLTGATAGSTKATIMGGLGVAGITSGVALGAYGISESIKDFKDGNTGTGVSNAIGGGLGLAGAGALTAGMLSVGAANAWNPLGWGLLIASGVTLLGTAIYKGVSNVSGAAEHVEEEYTERLKSIREQNRNEKLAWNDISKQLDETSDLDEKRNLLINSGLLSQADVNKARDMDASELEKLTSAYIQATKDFSKDVDTNIQKYKKEDRETAEAQQLGMRNAINEKMDAGKINENWLSASDAALYTLFEDLETRKKSGEEFDKHTKRTYKELSRAYADGKLTKKELNAIIDEGFFNDSLEKAKFSSDVMNNAYQNYISIGGSEVENDTKDWIKKNNYTLGIHHGADRTTEAITLAQKALDQTSKEGAEEYLKQAKAKGYKSSEFSEIKNAADKWGLTGYKLGSSYIPNDMLAILHAGERVLTANQNKEYTEELQTGNGSIIVNSIQDVVSAIQNQTKTIIDYLSTMNFNNSSGFKKMSMLPSMGNTKVTL